MLPDGSSCWQTENEWSLVVRSAATAVLAGGQLRDSDCPLLSLPQVRPRLNSPPAQPGLSGLHRQTIEWQSRVKFHRQSCSLCSPRWMLGQCLIRLSITISPGRQVRRGEKVTQSAWEMGELCFDFSTSYLTLQSSLWNTNMQNFLFIPSVSEEGNIQILNITWLSIKVHYYLLSVNLSVRLLVFIWSPRCVV